MSKPRINTVDWSRSNPHRFRVVRSWTPWDTYPWEVWTGYALVDVFASHAEALAKADEEARQTPANSTPATHSHPTPTNAPQTAREAAQDTLRAELPKLLAAIQAAQSVHANEPRDSCGRKAATPTKHGGWCASCGRYSGLACPTLRAITDALIQ